MVIDRELSSASFLTTGSVFESIDEDPLNDLTVCATNLAVLCLLSFIGKFYA
jgi:hypothetical protein